MRKLDALAAERVMGGWGGDENKLDYEGQPLRRETKFSPWVTWSPSTSIADAWELVERIAPRWTFMMSKRDDDWWATFYPWSDENNPSGKDVIAATAPLAITLAALRAVGVSEAEIKEAMREEESSD